MWIFAEVPKEDIMPIFELFLKLIVPTNNQILAILRFVAIQSRIKLPDTD
jgi:hypothetical protein